MDSNRKTVIAILNNMHKVNSEAWNSPRTKNRDYYWAIPVLLTIWLLIGAYLK